jgi:phosphatidylethanolamine/phosphatidyl-N-methylethanolamine N-methyltransferase
MRPDAQLLLFELDPDFSRDLTRQFARDRRVSVINANAATIRSELARRGIAHCDYIISGIPFSILEIEKKRDLLRQTHDALAPGGAFIIYQVTNELRQHATDFAPESASEYFLQNIPPMFITVFRKTGELNGNGAVASADARFSSNYAQ